MDTKSKSAVKNGEKVSSGRAKAVDTPRSLPIAIAGIRTGADFANMMSALMSDLIEGKITPGVGNAAVNAGGKLLKIVELQAKYGQKGPGTGIKTLQLAGVTDEQHLLNI